MLAKAATTAASVATAATLAFVRIMSDHFSLPLTGSQQQQMRMLVRFMLS